LGRANIGVRFKAKYAQTTRQCWCLQCALRLKIANQKLT
jgi:hypothetical protein